MQYTLAHKEIAKHKHIFCERQVELLKKLFPKNIPLTKKSAEIVANNNIHLSFAGILLSPGQKKEFKDRVKKLPISNVPRWRLERALIFLDCLIADKKKAQLQKRKAKSCRPKTSAR